MEGTLRVQATKSASSVEVTDGTGVVGHAGAALLRELADRVELTSAFGWREPGERRRHPDAAVLRDLAVMLADGGDGLSDLAVLRDQPELFGPVASTPTAWRVLERVAQDPDGLAGLRAARGHARARGWAAGAHPRARAADRGRRRHLGAGPQRSFIRKARRAPPSICSGSIRCWPTWTAARRRANRWPASCGRAMPPPVAAMT